MKKPPSRGQRLQWQDNAKTRLERAREIAAARRRYIQKQQHDWQGSKQADAYKNMKQVYLPKNFSLSDNYNQVVQRIKTLAAPENHFIHFNAVRRISAAAALMLAAELEVDMIRHNTPRMVAHDTKWNPQVRELLEQMGFMELLSASSEVQKPSSISNTNEVFVKFKSGYKLTGKAIKRIISEVENSVNAGEISPELRLPLNEGMAEAITNTRQHAYRLQGKLKPPGELDRWWISASVNRITKEITVVCYDRGRTIPSTIRASKPQMKDLFVVFADKDHKIIRSAMEKGQSSTHKKHRGKGLPRLINLIQRNGQGTLKVYSGRGKVQYAMGENGKYSFSSGLLFRKMHGTLVEWSIIPSTHQGRKNNGY